MTKEELIENISDKTNVSKADTGKVVKALFKELAECMVRKDSIHIFSFGTFDTTYRKERRGINPKTGEEMTISACYTPTFKASIGLKKRINQK